MTYKSGTKILFSSIVLLVTATALVVYVSSLHKERAPDVIRYVALGDSYTMGKHVHPQQRWTNLLVDDLNKHGIPIKLVANLSEDGMPTQGVITDQLPLLPKYKPTFVTLLIGVNDLELQKNDTYRKRLGIILDTILKEVKSSDILVLTLPDTTSSPQGKLYANKQQVKDKITAFNTIINEECQKRNIKVSNVTPVSETSSDVSYFADSLHPSPKQHLLWEKVIYKDAYTMLNKKL